MFKHLYHQNGIEVHGVINNVFLSMNESISSNIFLRFSLIFTVIKILLNFIKLIFFKLFITIKLSFFFKKIFFFK
jgi:hypothetical protein